LLNQIDGLDVSLHLDHIDPINKTTWNNLELFQTLRKVVLAVVLLSKGVLVERLAE
jgi:hypothetical protein